VARGQVDDAQPPHAEADAGLDMNAFIVRPTVPDDVAHPVREGEIALGACAAAKWTICKPGYSTHKKSGHRYRSSRWLLHG
jgi:hypothetical protein